MDWNIEMSKRYYLVWFVLYRGKEKLHSEIK